MNTAMQSFGYGLAALLFCIAILGVCHNIKKAARKGLKMKQNNLVLANSRLSSKLFIRFTSKQAPYRLLRLFYKSQSALILLLLLSQSHPSVSGCDLGLSGDLRDAIETVYPFPKGEYAQACPSFGHFCSHRLPPPFFVCMQNKMKFKPARIEDVNS